jgi:hypothetical protein
MTFEWDPEKATENRRKHGVSFEEAATVFGDRFAITSLDPDHSVGEYRFLTFGATVQGRLIVVAHAERDDKIRIVSARETTPKEKRDYEQTK